MGVYIKGMEMPKSCSDCKLRMAVGCCGNLPHNTRMPNCPLIPVPPHGRLIDAGYLYAGIETRLAKFVEEGRTAHSQQYEFGYWRGIEDAKSALSNAPTIIPEEEGER